MIRKKVHRKRNGMAMEHWPGDNNCAALSVPLSLSLSSLLCSVSCPQVSLVAVAHFAGGYRGLGFGG